MQVIATGKANKYITGNPQTSFFKDVYYRHTNFAMESIPCVFNTSINDNSDTNVSVIIHKSGDLVNDVYLEFELELTTDLLSGGKYINFTNSTGYAIIKHVTLLLNNEEIDKHYGEWFDIWDELTTNNNKQDILVNKHQAKYAYLKSNNGTTKLKCYVPLQFWFCRNPGLALPLIALQRVTVSMNFLFRNPHKLINTDHTSGTISISYSKQPKLYVNYIFLDSKERKDFASKKHQYLIEQVQFNGNHTLVENNEINFNNIIKEIIWITRKKVAGTENSTNELSTSTKCNAYKNTYKSITQNNDYFNYMTDNSSNIEYLFGNKQYESFSDVELFINGSSRFDKRNASYFRTIQPYQYHTKIPNKYIYSYSFALKPEEHQPSGICNVSKLKSVQLKLYNPNPNMDILIFGFSYNLLRIMDGMGGLAYTL